MPVYRLAGRCLRRTNALAEVGRLSSIELERADMVMKSKGSLLENSLLLEEASIFGLMEPQTNEMRPTHIVESNLLYLKSTNLNDNLIKK